MKHLVRAWQMVNTQYMLEMMIRRKRMMIIMVIMVIMMKGL